MQIFAVFVVDDVVDILTLLVFSQTFRRCLLMTMLQTFSRYLSFRKDTHQLLLFLLRQLAQDQSAYQRSRYGATQDQVQISEKDLADKVRVCRVSRSLENCVTHVVGSKHVGRVGWSLDSCVGDIVGFKHVGRVGWSLDSCVGDIVGFKHVGRVGWSLDSCVGDIVGFKHVGRVGWSLDDNALWPHDVGSRCVGWQTCKFIG